MSFNPTPKKSLGQHWLYDERTLESICDAANVQTGDTVLEVGPGLGTLTKRLLARGAKVTAVEFDDTLAANLVKNVQDAGVSTKDLTVVHEDILRFDLTKLPANYKVVANIPYYLTSNLIRVLCESTNPFDTAAILIQKEVAERVAAKPGNMSLLSISAQFYCEAFLDVSVPAMLFTPPPKVDSQVLVLKYRTEALYEDVDTKQFFRIVRAGFSQKRKTLANSLSGGLAIDKDEARTMLQAADIPDNARAQTLSLDDWYALYEVVTQAR
ncbi:MAG TPA: 16S rRNA (adenine(1518)-N(6)/adenine(1519)-N(6))-dimethyltransferase RsmA [Candidatus Saccharimonadia bacterium]|nr:16S rRNA (adenine(1518)-N(6)/adenine(1519)-N(6))-dimethyltransferase RsmA [Candidatus Saccharimonadia bacterium]